MGDFAAKRNELFACLDNASKDLKGTGLDQMGKDSNAINLLARIGTNNSCRSVSSGRNNTGGLSRLRGKESLFKKPELPIGRCLKPRKAPDFQLNPHKWKKYSLSDVDISDRTNTAAAFEFLKQIDDQHEADDEPHIADTNNKHIEFKRSSKLRREIQATAANEVADVEMDKPRVRGSKLVMPEYVVGRSAGPRRRRPASVPSAAKIEKPSTTGQLQLSHLSQLDEDEME